MSVIYVNGVPVTAQRFEELRLTKILKQVAPSVYITVTQADIDTHEILREQKTPVVASEMISSEVITVPPRKRKE